MANILNLREFCSNQGFVQLYPDVRTNSNDYPFITFMDSKNVAENIYFGKELGNSFVLGQILDKSDFDDLRFTLVSYDDEREDQWKIAKKGTSSRVSIADLI